MEGKAVLKFVARVLIIGGVETIITKGTEAKRGMVKETIEAGGQAIRTGQNWLAKKRRKRW